MYSAAPARIWSTNHSCSWANDSGAPVFMRTVPAVRGGVGFDEYQAPGGDGAGVDQQGALAGVQLAAFDGGAQVEQDVVGAEVSVVVEVVVAGGGDFDVESFFDEVQRAVGEVVSDVYEVVV